MEAAKSSWPHPAAALPFAGAVLGLLLVGFLPSSVWGVVPAGGTAAVLLLSAATAGSLHRPFGTLGLGLGAAAAPLAFVLLGLLPGAALVASGSLLAELIHRWVGRRSPHPRPERRSWLRTLGEVCETFTALIAAGAAWVLIAPRGPLNLVDRQVWDAAGLGAAAYLMVLLGLRIGAARWLRPGEAQEILSLVVPRLVDLAGWTLGIGLVVILAQSSGFAAFAALLTIAALAAEAARVAFQRDLSAQRIYALEEVGLAGQRLLAGGQDLTPLVERARIECRKVVPFLWFHLEIEDPTEGARSWSAGPSGDLIEGAPEPDESPPALPGMHRRSSWHVLEYPLRAGGTALGRVRFWCDPRRLRPEAQALLERLVPQVAGTLHRTLLDSQAKRDPLTGISGRRVLEESLEAAYERCVELGGSMAVLMCDLDHFKRINDEHGHQAGDEALIAFSRLLVQAVPEGALCCRYGGEEFTVLLDGFDGARALQVAEAIRLGVSQTPVPVEGGTLRLTVSVGAAAFPDLHIKSADELLILADGALYEAKRQGRDRCLLNLGRGHYREAGGQMLIGQDREPTTEVPRIFA